MSDAGSISELLAARRAKLDALRAAGVDPFPHEFEGVQPIAAVGFRPFGQTSTQFMIVWQRKRRYGSSRLSRRSFVASSRLSAMKR